MKTSRFTEEQIAFAIKQSELGTKVEEICRKIGISDATLYKWRQKYAGLGPSELKKLKQLEEENSKADHANQILRIDSVADNLFDGRKLRRLTVVDCHTRESLAVHVGQSLNGEDVVQVLSALVNTRGKPAIIKTDNGSEFVGKVMDKLAYENGIEMDLGRPGKSTDNAMVESFNGRLRQECLNQHWVLRLQDAKTKIEAWRRDYNEVRPHTALDRRTPHESALQAGLKARLQGNLTAGKSNF